MFPAVSQNRTRIEPHPVARYADRVRLIHERRRAGDSWIEAQVRIGGKWSAIFSLRTKERDEALMTAVEELNRREQLHSSGLPQPGRVAKTGPVRLADTFADATLPVLKRLEAQRAEALRRFGKGKANKYESHISCIRSVLLPAFGDLPVVELTNKRLNEWARNLKVKGRRGAGEKAPSQNTIGNYNHSLQKVLDHAVEQGWIDEGDKPSISKAGFDEAVSTPRLPSDEIRALRDHMTDAWVEDAHRGGSREVRYLLRAYVALCSCTGIRPGEEMELILAHQLIVEGRGQGSYIRIPVVYYKGKKKRERDVIVFENDHFDVRRALFDLLRWREDNGAPPRSPIFALPSNGEAPNFAPPFKRLMVETGLLVDSETGLERVPYSMRHYFATQALLRGEDDYLVAKWMSTSTKMLELTYNKIKLRMVGAALSGAKETDRAGRLRVGLRRRAAEERAHPHYLGGGGGSPKREG